jgi:hypothetical protein
MTCVNHAEVENTAFCTQCGKPLCAQCVRQVQSSVYCETCLADSLAGRKPPTSSAATQSVGGGSPEAAFILGLIPSVGAIYNAEYFKALIHMVIFGSLITLADHARPFDGIFVMLAFGFYVYMPFEAYYTAKKRKLLREGIHLETPFDRMNEQMVGFKDKELWGGIILVVIGGLFLLDNFNVLTLNQVTRLWPALLIAVGILMIRRFQGQRGISE